MGSSYVEGPPLCLWWSYTHKKQQSLIILWRQAVSNLCTPEFFSRCGIWLRKSISSIYLKWGDYFTLCDKTEWHSPVNPNYWLWIIWHQNSHFTFFLTIADCRVFNFEKNDQSWLSTHTCPQASKNKWMVSRPIFGCAWWINHVHAQCWNSMLKDNLNLEQPLWRWNILRSSQNDLNRAAILKSMS